MDESRVPITAGSRRARFADTGSCRITEAWFPAGSVLAPHRHDRHVLAVMLDGAFETRIGRHRLACSAGTTWTEPCEDPHANHVGRAGAHVIVLQPRTGNPAMEPFGSLLHVVWTRSDPAIAQDARRIVAELARPDSLTPLSLDALVALMCARAARLRTAGEAAGPRPRWLCHAREFVHAHFRDGPTLTEVAAAAGVPSWHLAREFRRHFHASIGAYARALRVNWALERLGSTDVPLSEVALEAGYADQSHLTRDCRRATGLSPLAYRRRVRERLAPSPR